MANYNLKLDLSKLQGFGKITLQGKSGQAKRCIVVPIEDNGVFEGEKGTYLDLVCIETPNSEYGSHMVTMSSTKEERDAGVRKPIVGNLKQFGTQSAQEEEEYSVPAQQGGQQQAKPKGRGAQPTNENLNNDASDDLPF